MMKDNTNHEILEVECDHSQSSDTNINVLQQTSDVCAACITTHVHCIIIM